jgi:Acetyltransferase (GNAT) domain
MIKNNYQRMFDLIDDVFATRNDPNQLQVNHDVMKRLNEIHPATLSEIADENGPLIWALIIPTTTNIMNDFLLGKISENDILKKTKPGQAYNCIYLCSVTTLPEMRGKGKTKRLCLDAIQKIRETHSIQTLFVWAFTKEGEMLAETLSKSAGIELKKRTNESLKNQP